MTASKTRTTIAAGALALAAMAACSKNETAKSDVIVHGTVAQGLVAGETNAIAVGRDGRWYSTPVSASGRFELTMPAGQSYRIVLTQTLANAQEKVVARVVLFAGGTKSVWIDGKEAADIHFGTLHEVGSKRPTDPSTIGTLARGSGRGGFDGDHDDDDDADDGDCTCKEHDKDDDAVCSGGGEKEVTPSDDDASDKCDEHETEEASEPPCTTTTPAAPSGDVEQPR